MALKSCYRLCTAAAILCLVTTFTYAVHGSKGIIRADALPPGLVKQLLETTEKRVQAAEEYSKKFNLSGAHGTLASIALDKNLKDYIAAVDSLQDSLGLQTYKRRLAQAESKVPFLGDPQQLQDQIAAVDEKLKKLPSKEMIDTERAQLNKEIGFLKRQMDNATDVKTLNKLSKEMTPLEDQLKQVQDYDHERKVLMTHKSTQEFKLEHYKSVTAEISELKGKIAAAEPGLESEMSISAKLNKLTEAINKLDLFRNADNEHIGEYDMRRDIIDSMRKTEIVLLSDELAPLETMRPENVEKTLKEIHGRLASNPDAVHVLVDKLTKNIQSHATREERAEAYTKFRAALSHISGAQGILDNEIIDPIEGKYKTEEEKVKAALNTLSKKNKGKSHQQADTDLSIAGREIAKLNDEVDTYSAAADKGDSAHARLSTLSNHMRGTLKTALQDNVTALRDLISDKYGKKYTGPLEDFLSALDTGKAIDEGKASAFLDNLTKLRSSVLMGPQDENQLSFFTDLDTQIKTTFAPETDDDHTIAHGPRRTLSPKNPERDHAGYRPRGGAFSGDRRTSQHEEPIIPEHEE